MICRNVNRAGWPVLTALRSFGHYSLRSGWDVAVGTVAVVAVTFIVTGHLLAVTALA